MLCHDVNLGKHLHHGGVFLDVGVANLICKPIYCTVLTPLQFNNKFTLCLQKIKISSEIEGECQQEPKFSKKKHNPWTW